MLKVHSEAWLFLLEADTLDWGLSVASGRPWVVLGGQDSAEETDISGSIKEEGTQLEKAEDLPPHSAAPVRVSNPEVLSKLPQ